MADKSAPPGALRLQWIYGYGGHGRRDNLHFNAAKEAVYFAAGACIVYNAKVRVVSAMRRARLLFAFGLFSSGAFAAIFSRS